MQRVDICSMIRHRRVVYLDPDGTIYEQKISQYKETQGAVKGGNWKQSIAVEKAV